MSRTGLGRGDRDQWGIKVRVGTGEKVMDGDWQDCGDRAAAGETWLQGWNVTLFPCPQVRRAIQQMLFQGKDFSWIRHVTIALVLLTFINLLVIFAPSILGIFGMIGVWPSLALGVMRSTTAPAWCSALPDLPVPQFPLFNVPGQRGMWDVSQPRPCPSRQVSVVQYWLLAVLLAGTCSSPGCSP